MRRIEEFQADNFLKKRKVHKYIRRAVALLSAFVMLFTVNTLKRNANTLERIPTCGYEEHVHDGSCFNEAGELICGMEEHIHTDACYQAAPADSSEEIEVELGEDDEGEPPTEEEVIPVEAEAPAQNDDAAYALATPALVSGIVAAKRPDVDMKHVVEVGAIEDDAAHAGLLGVEFVEGGDWLISAQKPFNDAELALILDDGSIEIVELKDGVPADAEEPETDEEQTEVESEQTEDGLETEEPTEVDIETEDTEAAETDTELPAEEDTSIETQETADAPEADDGETTLTETENEDTQPAADEQGETQDEQPADDEQAEAKDEQTADAEPLTEGQQPEAQDEQAETQDEQPEDAEATDEETAEDNGDEETELADETEGDETDETNEETEDQAPAEEAPSVSVTVDLSSVDLMDAASVEADTVKLSVADLLNAEDDAVQLDGELAVDSAAFADAATVVAADNVAVEDGVITLTAEAMEAGSVTLEMTTEAEPENEGDEPVVTTQTVQIDLTGYTGRVTEEIKSDPEVQIVPAEGNSLPADAYAAVTTGGDVPEELLDAEAAESETTVQSAAAFDITITNDNNDEISKTGEVEVTLMPGDLNALADVPEDATVENLEYELYHVHDDGTIEKVEDAVFDVAEDGTVNSVTFTTDSFSTYVVKYTVDFTYVDASGEKHFWQFPGVGSHALREVLSALGIEGETIADPELELTEAVDEVGENDLYLTQDLETAEWFINSDAPFDDTYTLTVTVDEVLYTIIVTDDQEAVTPYSTEWDVTVHLYERNGSDADTNNLTALRRTTYGVMAVIYDKYEGTPLGYKIMGSQFRYGGNVDNPDGCKNTMSLKFNLNECRKLTQSGGAWVDDGAGFNFNTDENAWVVDADHKYAPKDVDIQFELFEAEDYGGADNSNRVSVDGWNSKSYQTAYQYARGVTGFEFEPWPNGHKVNANNTAELNLRRSLDKTYNLRVNVAPNSAEIPVSDYLYALVRLNAGMKNEMTGKVQISLPANTSTTDSAEHVFQITDWHRTRIGSNEERKTIEHPTFSGDETVEVRLYYKDNNGTHEECNHFDSLYTQVYPEIKSGYFEIKDGDTAYGMTASLTPLREIKNEQNIYDTIYFLPLEATGTITKSYIDSFLHDARDFGYYTLEYIGHSGDIEATIGANYMNADFLADYGYSQRNVQTNVLKVKKVYLEDGEPNPHQSVTIKLYKTDKDGNRTGEAIETKTGETNDKGILELEFTGLEPGGYTVSERLGSGPEIFPGSSGQVSGLTTTFSAADVRFVENGNVNYFGTIDYPNNDAGNELLDRMLSKGKRVPLVILTDTQATVDRINTWVSNHSGAYGSGKVSSYVNGTNGYKHYDIPSDMERLRELSHTLATATDSPTVRVVNVKASELTEEGLSFSNEKRFIVINVMMDKNYDTFCPMVTLNGRVLEGDFGRGGKENSTKVLFNLLNGDGSMGYGEDKQTPPEFNTNKTGAGVILAPWANAHELGGVFGGTIISATVDRKGNEIHSDNPNQRQNLNITIQNEEGTPKVGMLELRKAYSDPSIKDKITYFPFKVKLTHSDMNKIRNKKFPASGLKDDKDEVEFDANGEAIVWVRADNSVTIANLPAGTTYEVTEDLTGTDLEDLYTFVEAKNGKNSGTIVVSKTDSVTLINDVPRSGIKLKKVVEGTDATDKEFDFELYLWHKDGDSAATAFTNAELTNVTAKKNNETIALSFSDENYGGHAAGVYAFTLNNGDEIVIEGLPNGLHFAFVETGTDSLPDGYQVVTEYGKVEGTLPVSEAKITNDYSANGEVVLHAEKTECEKLGDKEFTFVLTDESGENELDRQTIKQGETADFDALTFVRNQRESDDNVYNFTVNKDVTTYTFKIHEEIPEDAELVNGKWVYDDVIYDDEVKTVTVTVKDDGKGHLEIVKSDGEDGYEAMTEEDLTQTFTNEPVDNETSVTVEKIWSDGNDKHSNDTVTVQLYKAYGAQVVPDPVSLTVQVTGAPSDGASSVTVNVDGEAHVLNQANGWTYTKSVQPGGAHTVALADNPYTGEISSVSAFGSAVDASGNITYTASASQIEYESVTVSAQAASGWTLPTDDSAINLSIGGHSYTLNNSNGWSVTVPASEKKFVKGTTPAVSVTGVSGQIAAGPAVSAATVNGDNVSYTVTASKKQKATRKISVTITSSEDVDKWVLLQKSGWGLPEGYGFGNATVNGNVYSAVTNDLPQDSAYLVQIGNMSGEVYDVTADGYNVIWNQWCDNKDQWWVDVPAGDDDVEINFVVTRKESTPSGGSSTNGTITIVNPNNAVNIGWGGTVKKDNQDYASFNNQDLSDSSKNYTVTIELPAGLYTIQGENYDWATFGSTNCWHYEYYANVLYINLAAGANETITLRPQNYGALPTTNQLASASPLDFLIPAAYADDYSVPAPDTSYLPAGAVAIADSEMLLGASNGWTYTWDELPKTEINPETGKKCYVYYYPVEIASTNRRIKTTAYTPACQTDDPNTEDDEAARLEKVTINNTVEEEKFVSISVTKKWSDNVWPENVSQVQVTLKANGSDANVNAETNGNAATVTLTENDNSKTWVHLPMKDDNDQAIVYTVEETSATIDGVVYTQTGDKKLSDVFIIQVSPANVSNVESASVEVTNTYITATPNVVKLIDGKAFDGKLNGEDISFKFTIRQIDPEGQTYEKTVTSASDGSVTFPAIVYTTAGTYRYEIRETVVANDTRVSYVSTPLYWLVIVDEQDGKLVKTKDNYHSTSMCIDTDPMSQAAFNNHELTYVDIVKQWCLNAGEASDGYPFSGGAPTVKVYLHRKTVGSDVDKIIDADPNEDGDQPFTVPYDETEEKWYLHIPGLEKYDKNGNEYQYYIVEDASNMQGWTPYLYKAEEKNGETSESLAGGTSTITVTGEGTLTVVNSMSQVALPATGGAGTNAIYAAGAGLVLLALGWWLARMKKRDNDA